MIASSHLLTPANREKHLLPISQIVSDQYANGQYVNEISRQYIGNCHYDWEVTRLGWDGDQLIHHWGVWGYPMRIESARLKTAGIGAVVTRESYRKQGLMQRAARESIRAMKEFGYDLSILRGRHYVKFGYARAWNYVTVRLKPEEIPALSKKWDYRALNPNDIDDIIRLYNDEYAPFSGSAVRPTYRVLAEEDMGAYGWFEGGKLIGYVRAVPTDDKKTLQCLEATGDVAQGLAALAELFKQAEYESLTFFTIPYHHPIVKKIRRGACVIENKYFDISGWRVLLINLHSALEKLAPLFSARLENSRRHNWRGEFFLDAGEQKATLEIENGKVNIRDEAKGKLGIQGGHAIARFLIGSDDPEEIIQQEGITCDAESINLANILFPNLYPMLSHWDEY